MNEMKLSWLCKNFHSHSKLCSKNRSVMQQIKIKFVHINALFMNYEVFMQFEINCAKLHHCIRSELSLARHRNFVALRRLHRVFDGARFRARAARFESLRMLK